MATPLARAREHGVRNALAGLVVAVTGAALGIAATAPNVRGGLVIFAGLLGAVSGALLGWGFGRPDPMESDTRLESHVGAHAPDDALGTSRESEERGEARRD